MFEIVYFISLMNYFSSETFSVPRYSRMWLSKSRIFIEILVPITNKKKRRFKIKI